MKRMNAKRWIIFGGAEFLVFKVNCLASMNGRADALWTQLQIPSNPASHRPRASHQQSSEASKLSAAVWDVWSRNRDPFTKKRRTSERNASIKKQAEANAAANGCRRLIQSVNTKLLAYPSDSSYSWLNAKLAAAIAPSSKKEGGRGSKKSPPPKNCKNFFLSFL